MSFQAWVKRLLLISLMLTTLIIVLVIGRVQLQKDTTAVSHLDPESAAWSPAKVQYQSAKDQQQGESEDSSKSLAKPTFSPKPKVQPESTNNQPSNPQSFPQYSFKITQAFKQYKPRYEVALADPSNYGDRYPTDINGLPVNNQAIIVLHETSDSAQSAINTFQTRHDNNNLQVSYHALIKLDGTVVYIVPPEKRAFGAGNSVFDSPNGSETVQTNADLPPSVNNFAYHVSLETPPSAWGQYQEQTHSGYTDVQYESLAWLVAQSQVPDWRVTTHRDVDRSGTRIDPRSFDADKFLYFLHSFREAIVSNR